MRHLLATSIPTDTHDPLRHAPEPGGTRARALPLSSYMRAQFRNDVLSGLRASPRRLSSLYFYDDRGSALFDEITRLPEYYLSRIERSILEDRADAIGDLVGGAPVCVVDLGAGSGDKTQVILQRLRERGADARYAPLDVSAAALWDAEQRMRRLLPGLRVDPVHDEYVRGLSRVRAAHPECRLLVLWLGSSIGNFQNSQAIDMLRGVSGACARDDVLLVGFDLLKDPAALVAAYADCQGVTAEFNYNLLRRINRELGGNFQVDSFVHHATFLPDQGRMESYLISKKAQIVTVSGHTFELGAWEAIHTEVSCKYSEARVSELLAAAGLGPLAWFTDEQRQFVDVACSRAPVGSKKDAL
jgi:L-histidine Nalpha-methyltransferase